eukprot:CAMPEP_0180204798 /NCGR_PEP_ID=MMETSP0987-20121128/8620_1 /TAXON_ID=697907 /ORGANISM="non described non described, Strain CCMP2293" /LENGTH=150 /DNA_ID=CAMNT_0022160345 /DNA_START=185 /DNA_END=635 /DNA_ORIENTATION=-
MTSAKTIEVHAVGACKRPADCAASLGVAALNLPAGGSLTRARRADQRVVVVPQLGGLQALEADMRLISLVISLLEVGVTVVKVGRNCASLTPASARSGIIDIMPVTFFWDSSAKLGPMLSSVKSVMPAAVSQGAAQEGEYASWYDRPPHK